MSGINRDYPIDPLPHVRDRDIPAPYPTGEIRTRRHP